MERILKVLRFVDSLSDWTGKAVSSFIVVLALLVGFEVIARYVFESPTIWVGELSVMIFGTAIIIGGAYTLQQGGHVNMDIIHQMLPIRVRALVDILTSILAFAFAIVLLWKGGASAIKSIKVWEHASTLWAPPLYPFRIMLPLGAFLLLLQLTAKFIRDVITLVTGSERS
jgi:TRAP-type mannitol/chloroaromatic compound transport system permease small subunit